jgi:hypothetical protein
MRECSKRQDFGRDKRARREPSDWTSQINEVIISENNRELSDWTRRCSITIILLNKLLIKLSWLQIMKENMAGFL